LEDKSLGFEMRKVWMQNKQLKYFNNKMYLFARLFHKKLTVEKEMCFLFTRLIVFFSYL